MIDVAERGHIGGVAMSGMSAKDKLDLSTYAVKRDIERFERKSVSVLVVVVYLLITTSNVKHEDFLLGFYFKLPIIDISVSIFWFPIIAVALISFLFVSLFFHLSVLLWSLKAFHSELSVLPLRSDRDFYRKMAVSHGYWTLAIDFGAGNVIKTIILFFKFFIVFGIPCLILLYIQVKFLAIHEEFLNNLIRILILFFCFLSLLFGVKIVNAYGVSIWARMCLFNGLFFFLLFISFFCLFIATIPEESLEKLIVDVSPDWAVVNVYPMPDREGFGLLRTDPSFSGALGLRKRRVFYPTYHLLESGSSISKMSRNIIARDFNGVLVRPTDSQLRELGQDVAWESYGKGVILSGRDLRFADLSGSDLRKADLRGANLWGANLKGLNLDYSLLGILRESPDANCTKVEYNNNDSDNRDGKWRECATTLISANLGGASFRMANLAGVDLTASNLENSNFESSNLAGADIWLADLRGVKFIGTDLTLTDISGSDARDSIFILPKISYLKADFVNLSGSIIMPLGVDGYYDSILFSTTGSILDYSKIVMTRIQVTSSSVRNVGFSDSLFDHNSSFSYIDNAYRYRISKDKINDWLSLIKNEELRRLFLSKVENLVDENEELPLFSEMTSTDHAIFDKIYTDPFKIITYMAGDACKGKPSKVHALGLLRWEWVVKQKILELNISVFDTGLDQQNLSEIEKLRNDWAQVESTMSDDEKCPEVANAVRRAIGRGY